MPIIENIRSAFRRVRIEADKIQGQVPFVHLFGHEKSYGAPQPKDFSRFIQSYKSWAYACAWKNATSVAKNKIQLYKRTIENNEEVLDRIPDHPFLDVMKNVNPFSNNFELLTITVINMELTGNGYWWIPRNALGVPYMIWNIPSHWVTIVPSKDKFIEGYMVQVPGKGVKIPFDEEEVVHFKYPSPFDLFYGTGPLWAGAEALDLNQNIKTWGINYFMNNAQPSGVLTTDDSLAPEQYSRLRDMWNSRYRGSQNAGKIALLESGLKYQQIGSTIRDARFEMVSKDIRNEILSMFGVPASKLGLVEDVNRANADANDYTYMKDTILPKLILIEEKLNEKFMPIYEQDRGVELICKFDNPVPEDKDFKLRERESNIRSGVTTIDEEREKDGLEAFGLPETSVPLIPFSMTPAGSPKSDPTDFGGGEQEDTDPNKAFSSETKSRESKRKHKWEMFVIVTSPLERFLADRLKRFFDTQKSEVMANVNRIRAVKDFKTKDLLESILFSLQEANNNLKTRSEQVVRQSFVSGLQLGSADTGNTIDFELFEPNIARAVDQRLSFFVGRVNAGTEQLLREAINTGLQQGESIDAISRRIDQVFSYSRDFRSKRIARTEVIGGTNAGQLTSYEEAGIEKKEWLTARDERVRESHQIDGQAVEIHQSFTTGAGVSLGYPGDRSGGAPAGEVINCRCTVNPVI